MQTDQSKGIQELRKWYEKELSELQDHYDKLLNTLQTFEAENIQREREIAEKQIQKLKSR